MLKGDQKGVEHKCRTFEARVRKRARALGAKLVEAELRSAAQANELLGSTSPSEVFFIGHGRGGALIARDNTPIWPTDIVYNPAYLKITFRSTACELGARAKDWDLTFGDVYGSTHQAAAEGPFAKRRLHADQELYRDVVVQVTIIITRACSIKMRMFNEPAIVTHARVTELESEIGAVRAQIGKLQAEQDGTSDPEGGYSVGTAAQLLGDLERATAILRDVVRLAD
jgi:hypothetical protein